MMWAVFILIATLFVAYANGSNDNFKGVATLYGSRTASYSTSLWWATTTTFAGSIAAFFFAEKLLRTFSGKGLVPDTITGNPAFLLAVIVGAGLTVFVASKTGIPISTTHALLGALVGSGFVALAGKLEFSLLVRTFALPLLVSPLLAMAATASLYPLFRWGRKMMGIKKESCICVEERVPVPVATAAGAMALSSSSLATLEIVTGDETSCAPIMTETYTGKVLGLNAKTVLDALHFLSAGAVGFARGLNDTPKIVALIAVAGALGLQWNIGLVACAMALGGLLGAKRVARTVSERVTAMNDGQGFSANLITAGLVIFASNLGVPVSTTHVSCGALFGIGAVNGKARWNTILGIVGAWVLTLPLAALLAGGSFWILQ